MIPGDLLALGRYRLVYTRASVEEGQAMTDEAPSRTQGGGAWGDWEVVPITSKRRSHRHHLSAIVGADFQKVQPGSALHLPFYLFPI